MPALLHILRVIRSRRQAAQSARSRAENDARAFIARVSRRQALHELREQADAAAGDPARRRHIAAVREAVLRLTRHQTKADTATRMLYRDDL
jgi:hypothetical protein